MGELAYGDAAGARDGAGMAARVALLLGVLLVTHRTGDAAILEANGNLSCRCAKTTRAFIPPWKYSSIEVRPVGSSCRRLEVVIKLRGQERVCVDPDTPWVKKLLQDLPKLRKKEAPH
ncbi:alveolar macrophage chemotactic factor-like isoform X3 [Phalacrocorax carbo]|uniref:alveolar macrophage chemotactic factor-like isoform X3 n=1 Tax=Phalacrocorax carbo TaxID=9209 RepID=UPI0031198453